LANALIVGVDPGITTGIAVLDLSGNIVLVASKREMSRNEIIKTIINLGQPLIITSDVNPLPRTVEKIARKIHAKIYLQEESLHVAEKKRLVRDFDFTTKNGHETSALAACIKAWKSYRPFFSKIKEELKKNDLYEFFDVATEKLLRGKYDNIKEAVNVLKGKKNG
jgi:predicted RNase H-like nuclease (RuvC/YqgF family)